ncbi:thiosulfate oxidation carrier complex protein SoxZ [Massilia dura]|uniref:Thiosulfate oxidation carrier complex protein SoxZ n=1 Tax=Pseudoduganella dura TaxID=321982 RepID=A0A6I3XKM0_9BURK|nr:thiosulfate oxidation carrier complex protein SoxZ [Pseudoduganella dura]MUI13752.1 thiosulfate oxidation carrier complex protein SoxZ [Pseudoduganella dura]GGX75161.1 thiosulfate oxidation carrier complex protein SoxZ [Pseudoduganella dura]
MARALVHMPKTAKQGEVIEIRALIAHPMESGYRPGADGKPLPQDIIRRFACRYDGEQVFAAELHPAISANPYIAFFTVATKTGMLEFSWAGDNGFSQTERIALTVTP